MTYEANGRYYTTEYWCISARYALQKQHFKPNSNKTIVLYHRLLAGVCKLCVFRVCCFEFRLFAPFSLPILFRSLLLVFGAGFGLFTSQIPQTAILFYVDAFSTRPAFFFLVFCFRQPIRSILLLFSLLVFRMDFCTHGYCVLFFLSQK